MRESAGAPARLLRDVRGGHVLRPLLSPRRDGLQPVTFAADAARLEANDACSRVRPPRLRHAGMT